MTEFDPKSVAIATTTFYPDWSFSQRGGSVSNIRGTLAIEFAHEVVERGYQLIVVDGGSSDDFKSRLGDMGVSVQPERERGISASRRQSYREASNIPGVEIICTTEPEKVSFIRDCLTQSVVPIQSGSTDIVVPKRDKEALTTYPNYQVDFERTSNIHWNTLLRDRKLLDPTAEDIDICFGPKLFRNDPIITELFMRRFSLQNVSPALDQILNPESWHGAVVFPVVAALHERKEVVSIEVPYRHPVEQTEVEGDNDELRRKRDVQYKNLIALTIQYTKLLQDGPFKSRLVHINN